MRLYNLTSPSSLNTYTHIVNVTPSAIKAQEGLPPAEDHSDRMENRYKQILTIPSVHFMAFWTLVYVGVEVTLGGWIVTFIQEKRGGGASAGYISSGFFGGTPYQMNLLLLWVMLIFVHRTDDWPSDSSMAQSKNWGASRHVPLCHPRNRVRFPLYLQLHIVLTVCIIHPASKQLSGQSPPPSKMP